MSETDAVIAIVHAINDAWVAGRYEELERHFHPDVVLAFPGFEQRIDGRGPLIDSYRDFGEKSTLHAFEPGTPQVDRVGPTAIATTSFEIDYEFDGTRSREAGTDLLVLQRSEDAWQVVWRTVVTRSPTG